MSVLGSNARRLAVTGSLLLFSALTIVGVVHPAGATPPAATWTLNSPRLSPPAGPSSLTTYDAATGDVVLVDGANETWIWDGSNWLSRGYTPTTVPGSAMAYDAATRNVVLVDGVGQTWTSDGTNWLWRGSAPFTLAGSAMAYDAATGNVVLVDGIGETWTWDGTVWLAGRSTPFTISGSAMAYDAATGDIVLVDQVGQTWTWNGTVWLPWGIAAFNASGSAMSYDAATGDVVLVDSIGHTWTWDGTNWSLGATAPLAASSLAMAYDAAHHDVVLLSDTGQTWTYTVSAPSVPSLPTIHPPAAPLDVTASSNANGQSQVSWSAPLSTGGSALTGYTVVALDTTTTVNGGEYCTTSATSCVVRGLTNGDAYDFVVYAANVAGATASTPSALATPAAAPAAPFDVTASSNANGQSQVSWSAPLSTGGSALTGYRVSALDLTRAGRGGESCATTQTSCVVRGLTNGDVYDFVVVATNGAGSSVSAPSAPATPRTVASAPRRLRVTAAAGMSHISWRVPATTGGDPLTGYDLFASSTPDGRRARLNDHVVTSRTFTWRPPRPGTYYVVVRAVTLMGLGANSPVVKVVIP